MSERVDVLVIGAGLSGIGAAYRLSTECPDREYLILEGRDAIGGTWDLFRYPGVRSDSDMFTLGYPFRPWRTPEAIADGWTIREYIRDTARRFGIDERIRFGRRVVSASWSSPEALWTVRTAAGEEFQANFLYLCTGYYRYSAGHEPDFPGRADFAGEVVHPQRWPDDLDYTGHRVVVIGSGATAVTLVPAMAEKAQHVTMVQRSPSYLISLPGSVGTGPLSPARARRNRRRNIVATTLLYQAARRWPERVSRHLRRRVAGQLPAGVPVDPHFTPRYDPWDQRLCLVPDGDFFKAMRAGRASVATGVIERFTEGGVRLADGTEIPADLIVTATGLRLALLGEVEVVVDGVRFDPARSHVYKGMMFDGVPNLAWCIGYVNASWTLRADLTSRYVCRLLNYLRRHRIEVVTPRMPIDVRDTEKPLLALNSGYVRRAAAVLPRQGTRRAWRMADNYVTDYAAMTLGRIDDGNVRFARVRAGV